MSATAGAVRAGRAFVELFADDSRLVKGLRAAQAKMKAFGAAVTKMGRNLLITGGLITGPLTAAVFHFANAGDALDKMSQRTGVTVEGLSALGFAAERSGVSIETVEAGLNSMAKFLFKGGDAAKGTARTLDKLGLSMADLKDRSPEERFALLADRIAKIEDPTQRAALAMKVFGKAGTSLIPLLGNVDALMNRAKDLGIITSAEDAAAADAFSNAWGDVTAQLKAATFQVGAALAPALTGLLHDLTPVLRGVIEWIRENKEVVVTVAKVGLAITAAGAALLAIGGTATFIASTLGFLAKSAVVFGTVLKGTIWVVKALGAALWMIASPANIAVAIGIAAFLLFTEAGKKTRDSIAATFADLKRIVGETLGGIADAIMSGQLSLAGEIAMTGLELAWRRGTQDLRKVWIDFRTFMVDAFFVVTASIQSAWVSLVGALKTAWAQFTDWFRDTWQDAVDVTAIGIAPLVAQMVGADPEDTVRTLKEDQARARGQRKHADLAAIAAETKAQLEGIEKQRNASLTASDEIARKDKAALDQQVASLEERLRFLREQARQGREAAVGGHDKSGNRTFGMVESKASVTGTFNPAALFGLGGNLQKKIADATGETAKNTKKIVQQGKPQMAWE